MLGWDMNGDHDMPYAGFILLSYHRITASLQYRQFPPLFISHFFAIKSFTVLLRQQHFSTQVS